jgi:MoxR-like ATPase
MKKKPDPKFKVNVKLKTKPGDVVERFKSALKHVAASVVGRSDTLLAMQLALLSRSHILLDGVPGVAKSYLTQKVLETITGDEDSPCVVFKKQLMAGTMSDEIFGPMNSKDYREKAIWNHNTTGMLPSAHFAFLDEIYRASDSLLPSMMGILNEREFVNGSIVQKCPLLTAIGTTNFITDRPELEAFHDRWMIIHKVEPLTSAAARLKMMESYLKGGEPVEETITIDELLMLQDEVRKVELSSDLLSTFDSLLGDVRRNSGGDNAVISDRRQCYVLRLLQAGHLLGQSSDSYDLVAEEASLLHASQGLFIHPRKDLTDLFESRASIIIQEQEATRDELPKVADFVNGVAALTRRYDPGLSQKAIVNLFGEVAALLDEATTEPVEAMYRSSVAQKKTRDAIEKLNNLHATLASDSRVNPVTASPIMQRNEAKQTGNKQVSLSALFGPKL